MDIPPNQEQTRDEEFVLRYSNVDGFLGTLCIVGFSAGLTAGALIGLYWATVCCLVWSGLLEASAWIRGVEVVSPDWSVVFFSLLFACGAALFAVASGAATLNFLALGWRACHGHWWLRMSSTGLEVNDRVLRSRRFGWHEIDTFALAGNATVGLRFSQCRRHSLTSRFSPFGGPYHEGDVKLDAIVMGYWDRSFEEAVDLMNEWLSRHRANLCIAQEE